MANRQLIDFYHGVGTDAAGRSIAQVLGFDFRQLEGVHDYIQWLFPTATASAFNPDAPLLDDETAAVFRTDILIRERMQEALGVMLQFYGLELHVGTDVVVVRRGANYSARRGNWQNALPGMVNHNMLRITRILESLTLVGMEDYAVALYGCLADIARKEPGRIPPRTQAFWQKAVQVAGDGETAF
jgi:hypothetical protein